MIGSAVSDWDQFQTSWRFQMRFYLRTYRFFVPVIIALLFGSITVAIILYFTPAHLAVGANASAVSGSLISFVGLIVAIGAAFLGGDATSMDTGSATGYYTLVQPVRRSVLLLGRFAAAYVLLLTSALIIYAFVIAESIWVLGTVSPWIPASIGLLMIGVAAYLGLAFALSALADRPLYGIVLTFIVLFFGDTVIESILQGYQIEPWFLVDYGFMVVSLIFTYPWAHFSSGMWEPTLIEGIAILVAYGVVGVALALFVFHRQEVKT